VAAEVGWVGYSPGPGVTEYSEVGSVIDATGTVNLGDASLTFPPVPGWGGPDCRYLEVGQVYTLVHTTRQLTGTFNGIPNGTVVSVPSCNAADTVQINYSSNAVTATVVDGQPGPTWTSEALSPDHPAVNQPVTVTVTVDALYGTPAGTVTVYLDGDELPGCVSLPVQSSGSTGLATCQTSFGAAGGEQPIGSEFDSSNTQTASSSSVNPPDLLPQVVSVAPAPSSATLSASATRVAEGANVTYTATVAAGYTGQTQPTGIVEFLRDGKPIAACDHQPLTHQSTAPAAQCKTSFAATGTDAITAHYSGDANFTGSTTGAVRTVVVRMPLFAQLSRAIKRTKFAGLWTTRGADLPFDAERRGELVIRWYLDTGGGHKRLIATTKRRFKQAGTVRIRLALDPAARRTLSHLHHARVTAEASFTAADAQPVRAATSFTIKR
jgi:Bacterial Ig-like domain (group 3)